MRVVGRRDRSEIDPDALGTPAASAGSLRPAPVLLSAIVWLCAVLLAMFFALIVRDSTLVNGAYLPRGNDSFYHAHRILDALGARGFYQFDAEIQAPDGAWISWPWAYDYLMVKATQLARSIVPSLDPMAFLSHVPVAWILVNAALFMAAASEAGLSAEMRLLAMLSFALSPLTQLLHSIGMLDHHYVEHTFVLLTAWLGLKWFGSPASRWRAAALGVALGTAPAFHNGLFILQLMPLACVFVLWLRGNAPPARSLGTLSVALLLATQLILLPSEPYRNGMFEFGLLSWFHFYAAVCTSAALTYMGWRPFSKPRLAGLIALAAALAAPATSQLLGGAGFLAGSFSILDQIVEVRSPVALLTGSFGPVQTASYYSWLVLIAPLLFAWYTYEALRERAPARIYYAIAVTFGIALLLDQLRLHYYGFFGLVTGGLLIVDRMRARYGWHRGATFAATFALLCLAYQPPLRDRLFLVYPPAANPDYAAAMTIYQDLHDLCAADPGVVLASSDDGSPIVFHSDCSVIANNFILRSEDKAHIDEVYRLMRLAPSEIRAQRPDVKYMFVRAREFSQKQGAAERLAESSPIVRELFLSDSPPAGYTLIRTLWRTAEDRSPFSIYARLFKVSASATGSVIGD